MQYINEKTKQYPLSIEDIKDEYPPNTSFPAEFTPPNHFKIVHSSNQPDYDRELQEAVEIEPVFVDGKWYKNYRIQSKFKEYVTDNKVVTIQEQEEAVILKRKIAKLNDTRQGIVSAVNYRLDSIAQEYGYDSIISACSYANSTVEAFSREAKAFIKLRDDTWLVVNEIISRLNSGEISDIDYSEIESTLPSLVL